MAVDGHKGNCRPVMVTLTETVIHVALVLMGVLLWYKYKSIGINVFFYR